MNDTGHMVMQGEVPQKLSQPKSHWKGLSLLCFHCSSDFFLGCLVSLSQWKTNPAGSIEKQHRIASFRFSEPGQDTEESDDG